VGPGAGLNAAREKENITDGGNLTVITTITVDSVKHNNLFIQYYRSNMFRANESSSGWQEWKIKYTFLNGN
jgi:hypothetical protein